jgi:tetratricopeptide (TPR) repeat protein
MHSPRLTPIPLWFPILLWTPLATFGADTTSVATNAVQEAGDLARNGRLQDAAVLLETSRARAAADNNDYYEGMILNRLGLVYETQEKYLQAQKAFDNSIALLTEARGKNNPALLQPLNNQSQLLYEAGQFSQAEVLVRRNLAVRNAIGENNVDTGTEIGVLGKIYLAERKFPQAKQCAEDSLRVLEKTGHADGLSAALAYSILGAVYNEYGEYAGAQQSLDRSLSLLQMSLDPHDHRIGQGMANLGLLYAHQGLSEKAEPLLERAHGFFNSTGLNSIFAREFLTRWAAFERKWGHRKKAKELTNEVKGLAATSPEATFSRYLVDASAYR